jgi:hypothetical protein
VAGTYSLIAINPATAALAGMVPLVDTGCQAWCGDMWQWRIAPG